MMISHCCFVFVFLLYAHNLILIFTTILTYILYTIQLSTVLCEQNIVVCMFVANSLTFYNHYKFKQNKL